MSLDAFIEVAQWTGPRDGAQAYLDAANGNVEMALALYFEGGADQGVPAAPAPPPEASPPRGNGADNAPARSLVEELDAEYKRDLVTAAAPRVPSLVVYKLRLPLLSTLFGLLDNLLGFATSLPGISHLIGLASSLFGRAPTGEDPLYERFVAPSLARLGARAPPANRVVRRSYNDALELVKTELKFLLVIVFSEVHETPPADFLDAVLGELAPRDDIVVWVGSALSGEGLGVAEAFGADQLPLASLVGASPKTANSGVIVMERLVQLTGCASAASARAAAVHEFGARCARAIADHEPKLLALRLDRQQFSADRAIREEQDSAYERSLQADRQKAAEKREKEAQEQEQEQARATAEHERAAGRAAWLAGVASRAQAAVEVGAAPSARVSIRLPSGERLNVRIAGDAPVVAVYDIVYAHLHRSEPPFTPSSESGEQAEPDSVDPSAYGFSLTSTVVRRPLGFDGKVRDTDALWPNGVLMVELD